MQALTSRVALSRALGNVARVIEARNTLPILGHVRIAANDNRLTITGTDLDIVATDAAEADVSESGTVCVDAKLLTDIVRKVGADISLAAADGKLVVKSGRSRFSLATLPADDFPDFPAGEFAAEFAADIDALFAPVAFAISNEETRYYLNGVFFKGAAGKLTAVATDGHRLARHVVAAPTSDGAAEFAGVIVPRKLCGMLPKGEINIAVSESRIRLAAGDMVMESKLIDGTFPDYDRVIPQENPVNFTVDREDIMRGADRVVTISSERGRGVKLDIAPGGITLTAHSEVGTALDEVPAEYTGEPVSAGYNSAYLRDMLAVLPGGPVGFAVTENNSGPGVVTSAAMPGWTGVLMPLRVM